MKKPSLFVLIVVIFFALTTGCESAGTSDSSSGTGGTGAADVPYKITAEIRQYMPTGSSEENIRAEVVVREDGEFGPITEGAVVTVNGETLADAIVYYANSSIDPVSIGNDVTLNVDFSGDTHAASLAMPDCVANISADKSFPYDEESDLTVSWDVSGYTSSPDSVVISISSVSTQSGEDFIRTVDITDGSVLIPAGTLKNFTVTYITFKSLKEMTISGDNVMSGSYMQIAHDKKYQISTAD